VKIDNQPQIHAIGDFALPQPEFWSAAAIQPIGVPGEPHQIAVGPGVSITMKSKVRATTWIAYANR